jgi:hypothetical protein
MTASPTSIFRSSRGGVFLALVWLSAIGADSRSLSPASVRPAMALAVEVDGQDYQIKLRDKQTELVALFHDSVRAVLGRNFGFVRWDDSTPATDTLVLRVQQKTEILNAELALKLRGSRIPTPVDPRPIPFETFMDIQERQDWRPAAVAALWVARLDRMFQASRDEMVSEVFSQVPLALDAPSGRIRVFITPELAVQVKIAPEELNAAVNVAPRFRLQLQITDPQPPSSNAIGSVELTGCESSNDEPGYACQMGNLTYRGAVGSAAAKRDVLTRSTLTPLALYVQNYQPARFQAGAGGLIPQ